MATRNGEPMERGTGETLGEVVDRKIARRTLLKGMLAVPVVTLAPSFLMSRASHGAEIDQLRYQPISLDSADEIKVPPGYSADVLLRWGDPILAGAPDFDLRHQTAAAQSMQFGYNCDYVAFFPLGTASREASTRGILAVNHEYTNPELMFIDYNDKSPTKTQVDVQLAAHGIALVEIELVGDKWKPVRNSRYNRRITAETLMELTGKAAGNELLKTSYDSTGRKVRGTLNNCGGGGHTMGYATDRRRKF